MMVPNVLAEELSLEHDLARATTWASYHGLVWRRHAHRCPQITRIGSLPMRVIRAVTRASGTTLGGVMSDDMLCALGAAGKLAPRATESFSCTHGYIIRSFALLRTHRVAWMTAPLGTRQAHAALAPRAKHA
jgi:hypothetical protein